MEVSSVHNPGKLIHKKIRERQIEISRITNSPTVAKGESNRHGGMQHDIIQNGLKSIKNAC